MHAKNLPRAFAFRAEREKEDKQTHSRVVLARKRLCGCLSVFSRRENKGGLSAPAVERSTKVFARLFQKAAGVRGEEPRERSRAESSRVEGGVLAGRGRSPRGSRAMPRAFAEAFPEKPGRGCVQTSRRQTLRNTKKWRRSSFPAGVKSASAYTARSSKERSVSILITVRSG